jgi:hypothetical protein
MQLRLETDGAAIVRGFLSDRDFSRIAEIAGNAFEGGHHFAPRCPTAYCSGTFNAYPLVPLANGARCGNNPNSTTLRVTIVCAKR